MKAVIIGCTAVGLAMPIRAADYGSDVAVRSADELLALAASGEIDDDALDELLQLYEAPLDVRQASPEELALLPGIARSEARDGDALTLTEQAAAYARAPEASVRRLDSGGVYRDGDAPEAYLRLRVAPAPWLDAGATVVTRQRTRIDAALQSDGPQREVGLERWHLSGTWGGVRLVAGTYTCAFGESLTFSVARRAYAPALAPADALVRASDGSAVRVAPALRGGAVLFEHDGNIAIAVQAFASYRDLDLYQYGEWQSSGDTVTINGGDVRAATVSGAARETLGGAAVGIRYRDGELGVVAYAANMRLADPAGTFVVGSRYPATPTFGAVGVHGALALWLVRMRGEVTSTLAGGVGGVARLELAAGASDIMVAGRVYGVGFDNPYTRAVAEPDQYEGSRARNERGVELAASTTLAQALRMVASVDVWTALTQPSVVNARWRGRVALRLTNHESATLEGERVDKDVRIGGPTSSYIGDSCAVTTDCARGARMTGTLRATSNRLPHTRVMLALRRTMIETGTALAGETRATTHVAFGPWRWLSAALVATERLSARVPELASTRRLLGGNVAVEPSAAVRVSVGARRETRWLAGADHSVVSAALELTVDL